MNDFKKKKPVNQKNAFDYALRLLTSRGRSIHELTTRMQQKGYFSDVIDEVVDRLKSYGYLNDENFAKEYARSRHRTGRSVGPKAKMELRQKGIPGDLIDTALSEAEDEVSQREIVQEIRARRFKDFVYAQASEKEKKRVIGFFLRRGFQARTVMEVLKADPEDFGVDF